MLVFPSTNIKRVYAAAATVTVTNALTGSSATVAKAHDNFAVNVTIENCPPNLGGYEFRLVWNASILNCTSHTLTPPKEWGSNYFVSRDLLNLSNADGTQSYWAAVSATVSRVNVSSSHVINTFNFTAVGNGTTTIGFLNIAYQNPLLGDWDGNLIPSVGGYGVVDIGGTVPMAYFTVVPPSSNINDSEYNFYMPLIPGNVTVFSKGYVGIPVIFNASLSINPVGYISKYIWTFGDGNITIVNAAGPSDKAASAVTHTYNSYGEFKATLTVAGNGTSPQSMPSVPAILFIGFANKVIHIVANGAIEDTKNIQTLDNVTYFLTANINSSLVVERDNIVIDGKGFTLQGNGTRSPSTGLYLSNRANVTIMKLQVKGFLRGFRLSFCNNNTISACNASTNNMDGIFLDHSNLTEILRSNITVNNGTGANNFWRGTGIDVWNSNTTVISGNVIANDYFGINCDGSSNDTIRGNIIKATINDGISFFTSSRNTIIGNILKGEGYGIDLFDFASDNSINSNDINVELAGIELTEASNNSIVGNNLTLCSPGIQFNSASDNKVYHNNFVNYSPWPMVYYGSNTLDDGYPSGGNYWSDYVTKYPNATGIGGSGIWNESYVVGSKNVDHYPLMAPFKSFNVSWNSKTYSVDTVCNSTISNMNFNATAKTLSFNVEGTNGTIGFCRVAIPKSLMWVNTGENWTVFVNGTLITNPSILTDANTTYIYFTYHNSTELVQIQSTNTIPELQPILLLPFFAAVTLLVAILDRRKQSLRPISL